MEANKTRVLDQGRSAREATSAFSLKSRRSPGKIIIAIFLACTVIGYAVAQSKAAGNRDSNLTNIELLGKYVFFDKISTPSRMACVTCHLPETGGTGGVSGVNLHQVAITGANPHTVGNLKPPTNAYASRIPPLFTGCAFGVPGICGGNFWNGRAEGNASAVFPAGATKHIGDEIFFTTDGTSLPSALKTNYSLHFGPTADQALNPMPNVVEQNIDRQAVCQQVKSAKYAPLYKLTWGVDLDCSDTQVRKSAPDVAAPERAYDISFKRLMLAVCAWQDSADLNSFSSKRDIALAAEQDKKFPLGGLTAKENLGHDLFYNTLPFPFLPEGAIPFPPGSNNIVQNFPPNIDLPAANCSFCHSDNPGIFNPFSPIPVVSPDTGVELKQRYADNAYHNIGVPRNSEIPDTGVNPDLGLAGLTGNSAHEGFQKTPTLRNVDKRKGNGFIKAYTHNGWFKSLESIVHFYNTALIGGATANRFGISRCASNDITEKEALQQNCWPEPAVPATAAIGNILGNLNLTAEQEAAIVAYLTTLTDTYTPKAPAPYK
jgi:cytochrome c peroxidase